jgi:hypothetical protein
MQRLEVSGAVRLIYRSLGVKGLRRQTLYSLEPCFLTLLLHNRRVNVLQQFNIKYFCIHVNILHTVVQKF